MKTPYVSIFRSKKNRQFYWSLRSANHRIICQSEGYKTKRDAIRGAKTARRAMIFAHIRIDE